MANFFKRGGGRSNHFLGTISTGKNLLQKWGSGLSGHPYPPGSALDSLVCGNPISRDLLLFFRLACCGVNLFHFGHVECST